MNEDDFAQMFRDHYGAVLGYGMRRIGADGAHDVAAQTFAIAWQRLDAPPQAPLPWLLAVARRVLANELRRQQRREQLLQRAGRDHVRALEEPAGPVVGRETGEDVRRALALLSDRDQEVIRLVAWDELDHAAAAAVLGCSATAFRVRLHRARRRLRAVLGDASGPAPDGPAPAAGLTPGAPALTTSRRPGAHRPSTTRSS